MKQNLKEYLIKLKNGFLKDLNFKKINIFFDENIRLSSTKDQGSVDGTN